MTALGALRWRIEDCATNAFEWPDGFKDMWLLAPSTLIVNTFRDLLFFDASDPLNIRLVHRQKTQVDRTVRTRLCGTTLVCCGDEGVHLLDLTEPSAPSTIAHLTDKQIGGQLHSGWLADDGALFAPRGRGVQRLDLASGALEEVGVVPGASSTDAYAGDIIGNDTHVVTACHDHGVQIFARDAGGLRHLKGWSANTSCHLTWDGALAFFDVGESEALGRFTLDGTKPAKQKLWKTAKTWLAPQVVRRGDEILVAGIRHPDKAELQILVGTTTGSAPTPVAKSRVEGFVPRESCSDAMRGLVAVGDVLLVASYARRLYAVIGEP